MKKIMTISIMLMMLISIPAFVIADENEENGTEDTEIDNETLKETQIMNNSLGAEIRLLQLQKAILKNILKGAMAVEVLDDLEFNVTALEAILSEMKDLLEEVKEANTSSNESVQIFVELKYEAKNLTTQFRETIKELLDEEKLNEIRARIREMVSEELQDFSKWIRSRIRQFNKNQLYRLYGIIGEADNTFINEYLNETVSLTQVKLQINKLINQKTKEQRYEIYSQIKEENIKKKIHAQASVDNMKNKGKGKGKWS